MDRDAEHHVVLRRARRPAGGPCRARRRARGRRRSSRRSRPCRSRPTPFPAAGPDAHMTIYQPSTDRLWELFKAAKQADGWHASFGGAMSSTSTSPGYYDAASWPGLSGSFWGATATSLPVDRGHDDARRAQRRRHPARPRDGRPVRVAEDLLLAGAAHRRREHRPERDPRGRAVPARPEARHRRAEPAADDADHGQGRAALRDHRPRPDGPRDLVLRREPQPAGGRSVRHHERVLRRRVPEPGDAGLPVELAPAREDGPAAGRPDGPNDAGERDRHLRRDPRRERERAQPGDDRTASSTARRRRTGRRPRPRP